MRFTSLIVELIRARPRLLVWVVVLVQAAIWLLTPLIFYGSPPGDVATLLAFGREYQVGTQAGPPLAFWLADLAFRAAGNHIVGVYLLAQICFVVTMLALYRLGRALVGGPHAVLAVLLTMTITAFGSPGVEFGPDVLARPLWALTLLHGWQVIGQGRRNAWFALSIEAGLLLLTTPAAAWLLALLAGFALATPRGRQRLSSFDPLYAVAVVAALALPYLIWLIRTGSLATSRWPALDRLDLRAIQSMQLMGWLLLAIAAMVVLAALNSRSVARDDRSARVIQRAPVDPLGRQFVYFFAIAPAIVGCVIAGLDGRLASDAGVALLLAGLAVVVASGDLIALRDQTLLRKVWAFAIGAPALVAVTIALLQPWIGGAEPSTALPASAMARFFNDNFERRTNRPLPAVAGDPQIAALVALAPSRPRLLLDATPERTPWLTTAQFRETGGVVVWRATDTIGAPPADIAQRFPGLVAEIPRAFDRLVNGRHPPVRIGWAIMRPRTP